MGSILCVADMHLLPGDPPEQADKLSALLAEVGADGTLYCLGDTFNYWYEKGTRFHEGYRGVCALFHRAVEGGLCLRFVPGNRDSYAGAALERQTGGEVLSPAYLLENGGRRLLLTHGDAFCTDDPGYQRMRRHFFFGWGSRLLRAVLPWPVAMWIVDRVSRGTRHIRRQGAPHPGMGIVPAAAELAARAHRADAVLCGHAHWPEETRLCVDGRAVVLRVLPAWFRGHVFLDLTDLFRPAGEASAGGGDSTGRGEKVLDPCAPERTIPSTGEAHGREISQDL